MKKLKMNKLAISSAALALLLLTLMPLLGRARSHEAKKQGNVVYVCACLKTKSCSCMTEAKTEGPCACGTQGGPPLKAVSAHGSWAKQNRAALAK